MRVAFLMLILLLAPGASALTLAFEGPADVLQPGLGSQEFQAIIVTTCDELLPRVPPGGDAAIVEFDFSGSPVAMDPQDGIPVEITGPTNVAIPVDVCTPIPTANIRTTVTFGAAARLDSPGLVDVPLVGTATLTSSTPSVEPIFQSAGFNARTGYRGEVSMEIAHPIQRAEPGKPIVVELSFVNLGNADTMIHLEFQPSTADIAVPEDFVIPSGLSNGTGTAAIQITAGHDLGWNNEVIPISFTVTTRAADDLSAEGNTLTGSLLIRTRGFATVGDPPAVVIPGPGIPLLLAGAAAVALVRRRA